MHCEFAESSGPPSRQSDSPRVQEMWFCSRLNCWEVTVEEAWLCNWVDEKQLMGGYLLLVFFGSFPERQRSFGAQELHTTIVRTK